MTNALKKQSFYLVCFAFTYLIFFACVFYFERLNSDAGYYFFQTVNSRNFHMEHGRFVLLLAEILPLAGSLLHLPLKIVAVLYSLNHVLFAAMLSFLCFAKFKNYAGALLITVLQFAGLRFAALTPQFELFYGLSLLIFLIVYLQYIVAEKFEWNVKIIGWVSLLMLLVFTSHPMAIYCYFSSSLIYFRRKKYSGIHVLSILLLILYFIWKKFSVSDYETSKMQNFIISLNNNSTHHFLNFQFLKKGLLFLIANYADALISFAIGIVYFIRNKQILTLLLFIILIKASIVIIWLMFEPDTIGRYIEQVYVPFVFLSFIWIPAFRLNRSILIFLLMVIVFRGNLITQNAKAQKERTEQIAEFTKAAQQKDGTKFFVTPEDMGSKLYAQGNWSFGFETLIYSSIHYGKTVTITKSEDLEYDHNYEKLMPSDFLFRPFDIIAIESLNQQYFHLTEGLYERLIKN